jgi:arginine decarboxylase
MRYDLTELSGLDNLHAPEGVIDAAQKLAAQAWGADQTYFLVNGSTVGVLAAVLATCSGPQDALIIARNAHMSAFNAAALAGCTPFYAAPVENHGIAHHVTPESLEEALSIAKRAGRRPRAALIVSPTYFGVVSDITHLSSICHKYGAVLIVDEAHGAHLRFVKQELSALSRGADVAIQSTHKTLGALTQGAMLHVRGRRVDSGKLARCLQMLQSSSPSYLIMASLDAARAQALDFHLVQRASAAAQHIQQWFTAATEAARTSSPSRSISLRLLPTVLSRNKRMHDGSQRSASASNASCAGFDPWRFSILLEKGTDATSAQPMPSGWAVASVLERHRGVVVELATYNCIVCAVGIGTTKEHAEKLIEGLEWLCSHEGCQAALALMSNDGDVPDSGDRNARSLLGEEQGQGLIPRRNDATPAVCSDASQTSAVGVAALPEDGCAVLPVIAMTPAEALRAKTEAVTFTDAAGRVSAELLCPYPPGVPLVLPGEVIDAEILDKLCGVVNAGGKVVGPVDGTLSTLRVCCVD